MRWRAAQSARLVAALEPRRPASAALQKLAHGPHCDPAHGSVAKNPRRVGCGPAARGRRHAALARSRGKGPALGLVADRLAATLHPPIRAQGSERARHLLPALPRRGLIAPPLFEPVQGGLSSATKQIWRTRPRCQGQRQQRSVDRIGVALRCCPWRPARSVPAVSNIRCVGIRLQACVPLMPAWHAER